MESISFDFNCSSWERKTLNGGKIKLLPSAPGLHALLLRCLMGVAEQNPLSFWTSSFIIPAPPVVSGPLSSWRGFPGYIPGQSLSWDGSCLHGDKGFRWFGVLPSDLPSNLPCTQGVVTIHDVTSSVVSHLPPDNHRYFQGNCWYRCGCGQGFSKIRCF